MFWLLTKHPKIFNLTLLPGKFVSVNDIFMFVKEGSFEPLLTEQNKQKNPKNPQPTKTNKQTKRPKPSPQKKDKTSQTNKQKNPQEKKNELYYF